VRDIRFYRATGEYGWLSNLYRRTVVFEGRAFSCREAAYQYGKPKDRVVAEWIVSAPKPHLIAAAAHGLFVFDVQPDWSTVKVGRMRAVLLAFFEQHDDLRDKLTATRPARLVEQSNTDAFWGVGKKGNGKNMLGMLLEEVRDRKASKP
jgi:ribA/ribD-fused uncharacterized protein